MIVCLKSSKNCHRIAKQFLRHYRFLSQRSCRLSRDSRQLRSRLGFSDTKNRQTSSKIEWSMGWRFSSELSRGKTSANKHVLANICASLWTSAASFWRAAVPKCKDVQETATIFTKQGREIALHGRATFIQCGCWGGLCSPYEVARPPAQHRIKNRAPMGPEILSSTGAGVWRRASMAFPDSWINFSLRLQARIVTLGMHCEVFTIHTELNAELLQTHSPMNSTSVVAHDTL